MSKLSPFFLLTSAGQDDKYHVENNMEIIELLLKLVLAVALGGIIGLEREAMQKPAGLRTNIIVCITSTMMMAVAAMLVQAKGGNVDSLVRMAAGMMTGIGFLGAGTIIQSRGTVAGLTTASTLWLVAGLGLAIGAGYYLPALIFTALTVGTLTLFLQVEKAFHRRNQFQYHLKLKDRPAVLSSLRRLAMHHGVHIDKITLKKEGGVLFVNFAFSAPDEREIEFVQGVIDLEGVEELKVD